MQLYKTVVTKLTRFIYYYKLKLARLPASPHAVASGFACGSMVSFTPLLGLHFILAIVFAYLMRGNIVAALLGTIVGNPVTFPFIWGLIYKVGTFVISTKHVEFNNEINFNMIITQTYEFFLPMLLGGAILAIPVWLITYTLTHSFISSYKKSKIKKNRNFKR
tara:strand:+ start:125 stop:613 length:489 start_codon:yes stop_codon:yes gene_type:complete